MKSVKAVVTCVLSVGLLIAYAGASSADSPVYEARKHRRDYSHQYSSATERQLRNLRAYERGEYYAHDSNALPFGSRPWWEQKERESGGDFRR
jgi:hypothetical protein